MLVETIFWDFFRYSYEWKQHFPASENGIFIKSFITASVYGFWVNFKPCAFIQSFFFCYWKALLKLGANQFSSMFFVPNSGSSFPANGNGFSTECFETDFLSNAIHSDEGEQIFCLMFFYSVQISCWWKPFSTHFLYIYSCH